MSWFFGYVGINSKDFQKTFNDKNVFTSSFFIEEDICLIYDDSKNCAHNLTSRTIDNFKFLVSGTGISTGTSKTILCENDWREILKKEHGVSSINGHFAGVILTNNHLKLITDPIGLRDIYFTKLSQSEILFSTRIDLLVKFIKPKINYSIFGSRWLLFNQLTHKGIFDNIDRLVCGTVLTIDRKTRTLTKKHFNWLPENKREDYSEGDFENELISLINIYSNSANSKSLLLSGGLDSRVLLSLLINHKIFPFSIYTFGNKEHPDVKIAAKISSYYGLNHSIVDHNNSYPEDFWEDLKSFSTQTLVNNPVSSFLHFRAYEEFKHLSGLVIDGGFGEIWRREFLYRLSLKGKEKITKKDLKNILPLLSIHRADIFNPSIKNEMENGCIVQIDEIYNLLPSPQSVGVENWLDLFAVKTRMPNYYLHEQSRHDSMFTSLMPFVQLSLLNNLYNVEINLRKNGKLFKNIIRKNEKLLTGFPLVKGEVTLPFNVTSFQSRLISLLSKKIGADKKNHNPKFESLKRIKPIIKEMLKNAEGIELYNKRKINEFELFVESNTGDMKLWNEIDWWLAFESLRQSINLD